MRGKNPIMSEIRSIYGSRIRFIFRQYPLDIPAHDKNYDAAVAAEAAGMPGQILGDGESAFRQSEGLVERSQLQADLEGLRLQDRS